MTKAAEETFKTIKNLVLSGSYLKPCVSHEATIFFDLINAT
jgi:hypothetical protein